MTDLVDCTDPAIRTELAEIVLETLDGLLESTASAGPLPEVFGFDDLAVQATLQITGEGVPDQRFVLRLPAPTAIAIGAALSGEPVGSLDVDDARGTVAELCNLLAGTVKSLVEAETALHVPVSVAVPCAELEPLDVVEVHHPLGRFEVHLGT